MKVLVQMIIRESVSQIFYGCTLVHFGKCPPRDPAAGRYPRVPLHVNLVDHHNMKASNEFIYPISHNNPFYRILVGAVGGIAVIMEMGGSFVSAEQAKETWRILVDWVKKKYTIDVWLECVGGRRDPQDRKDEKRKKAILKLMFWTHTQKPIIKDIALDDDSFFDDIILDPFNRLDEESFPIFILHMHLITYRLADLIGIHQMTIKEIYFGCLLASNEVLSKMIDIQHNVNYRTAPILKKKDHGELRNPYTWNQLIDHKKVSVTADAKNDKVEDVDATTGCFIVLVRRCSGSSDSLTPHAEEQYKFSSVTESGFPVHETPQESLH
ncbi:hypothetical protein C1646_742029 [Rhizophagus diaphanus]|nr:hypothetical protein C1646_742029 [Rhizophagus diaphanus] [Rhizophagus sp. MUCL 43196]